MKIKICLICFLMILFTGCVSMEYTKTSEEVPRKIVKIGLSSISGGNKLEIVPSNDCNVYSNGKVKAYLTANTLYNLGIYKNSIVISGVKTLDEEIYLNMLNIDGIVTINGKKYRGNIIVKIDRNKFFVINELDIEEYLYGVVGREVSKTWPEEVLKAQAVAARTFAIKNLGKHKSDGYDLCDRVHCQVYGGMSAESDGIIKAVDDTRAEVVSYEDKLAYVFYHANCGGYTENVMNVWGSKVDIPYLRGRRCSYCKGSDSSSWKIFISFFDIKNAMSRNGYKVGNVLDVKIKSFTKSGRAKAILIRGDIGSATINGNKFRNMLGAGRVYSCKFKIVNKKDGIQLVGSGSGHGVGMCQVGAKRMADEGASYKDILEYYFSGVKITEWYKLTEISSDSN